MKNDEMEMAKLAEILADTIAETEVLDCKMDELRDERECLENRRKCVYEKLLSIKARLEKSGKKKPKR